MSALPAEQLSLDALVEVETGIHPESTPRTQQAKLFVVEKQTASHGLDAQPARKKRRKKKKKDDGPEYGRGVPQTIGYNSRPFSKLETKIQIGVLAHASLDKRKNKFVRDGREDFAQSGLSFKDWYEENSWRLEESLKSWEELYGWVPGWWNPTPVGKRPIGLTDDEILTTMLREYKQW